MQIDGAQVHCTYLSLKDYIRIAYQVKDFQVTGPGLDGFGAVRYPRQAARPAGAVSFGTCSRLCWSSGSRSKCTAPPRSFRFMRWWSARAALKLKESPLDPEPEGAEGRRGAVNVTATGGRGGTTVNYGRGAYFTLADNKFEARKLSMEALADSIGRFVERPVVDMTELKGTYDLTPRIHAGGISRLLIRMALSAGVNLPAGSHEASGGRVGRVALQGPAAIGAQVGIAQSAAGSPVIDSATKTPIEN